MFCDLPYEVVSEIASHLPYRDVVVLSKALVRKELRDAVNAHVVWLNLANQYLAENPHSHFAKMKSLSSLTTGQLRHRFEKRLTVNEIWRLKRPNWPSIKRVKCPPSSIHTVKIAPGGRWVFGGGDDCTMYYWDLESDNPVPQVLTNPDGAGKIPGGHCIIPAIDFAVETDDPLSGFVIASVGCHRRWSLPRSLEWLYIWDVVPGDNGNLETKSLKTVPLEYESALANVSLNEYLAARSVEDRVDVYWWKECTETHLVRCTLLIENELITHIYVLGHDKLLVYIDHEYKPKLRLYALKPERSEVGEYEKVVSCATKIWSLRFPRGFHSQSISRLSFDGTNYRQIICTFDGICSLVIPASQFTQAELVWVSDFNPHEYSCVVYAVGLSKGYCQAGRGLYRFGYKDGGAGTYYKNSAGSDSKIKSCHQLINLETGSFDEELGILIFTAKKYLFLFDFSLPLYNGTGVFPDLDQVFAELDIPDHMRGY